MIGAAMRFIFTFTEKFKRDQLDVYCLECGKQFRRREGMALWCSRKCRQKTAEITKPANEIGNIYHRPGG